MSGLEIGTLSILVLVLLLALKVNVGIAMGVTGFLGLWLLAGKLDLALGLLTTTLFKTVANFAFTVVPMYVLMGVFAERAGVAEEAYRAAQKWLARLPGGLAIATVVGNAFFGAACGSSIAACAVFTKVTLPEMKRHGYQTGFAGAAIASAGLLAMLIPPSALMIIYGILAEESIGALFLAGVMPGLILTLLYSMSILAMVTLKPAIAGRVPPGVISWKERLLSIRETWGIVLLATLVLGGIYNGLFSPTEAGAVGALVALLIGLLLKGFNWRTISGALLEAGQTTAMVFFVIIGATIYSKFVAMSGVASKPAEWVQSAGLHPMAVLGLIIVLYLVLGCLMDSVSMLTITLPVVLPIQVAMGWDTIWFALVVIMAIEIGLMTPPFALNLFTVNAVSAGEIKLETLYRAVLPFVGVAMINLVLIVSFPPISTWLPSLMGKQ